MNIVISDGSSSAAPEPAFFAVVPLMVVPVPAAVVACVVDDAAIVMAITIETTHRAVMIFVDNDVILRCVLRITDFCR